jgi:diazepam-binding inhibitor (GABA receptor modulating acyl-CoA-binding protein)
MEIAS